jgi:fructose-1,6-bisphosphatase/inositol monophosphatase family enzyme
VAQEAIAPRYRQLAASDVTAKAADDVVTVADTHAERLLAKAWRLAARSAIVGEEAAHADPAVLDRLGEGLCWIIDPLDGTNNFAAGAAIRRVDRPGADGECVAGWIYDVLSGRLCTAQQGRGAFVDGAPIRARSTGQSRPWRRFPRCSWTPPSARRCASISCPTMPWWTFRVARRSNIRGWCWG